MKRSFSIAAVAVAALVASVGLSARTGHASSRAACGVERWTVKTLQDRPKLLPARKTTIHYLITRPAPAHLPDTRLPFERHVFTVYAANTLVRLEADSDLHLILRQGGNHMIAEAPSPSCDRHATPLRRGQMRRPRPDWIRRRKINWTTISRPVEIDGPVRHVPGRLSLARERRRSLLRRIA